MGARSLLRIPRLNKQSCVILSLSFVFEAKVKALVMTIVVQVAIDSARDLCRD